MSVSELVRGIPSGTRGKAALLRGGRVGRSMGVRYDICSGWTWDEELEATSGAKRASVVLAGKARDLMLGKWPLWGGGRVCVGTEGR